MLVRWQQSSPRYPNQSLKSQDNVFDYGSVIRRNIVEALYPKKLQFFDADKNVILSSSSLHDFESRDCLGANMLGRRFLIGNYGKDTNVIEESLRGKIVGLFFVASFYNNTLKQTEPGSFEMIYVAWPSSMSLDTPRPENDPSLFDAIISTLPWLAVPLDWRSHRYRLYTTCGLFTDIVFIDTRDNKVEVFAPGEPNVSLYGPQCFPFTDEREQELEAEVKQLGKETSMEAILGSDSRDYLIDRHSNKVHISSLQNKDVLLYAYSERSQEPFYFEFRFVRQLEEIYSKYRNHGFEIVSINLDHNGGNVEIGKLWKDHLAQIPWLHLPLGDEKIWLLRTMMIN